MIIESLAKTAAKYLVVQIRPTSATRLHIQILAPMSEGKNRPYGFAIDINVPEQIVHVIRSILNA